CARDRGLLYGGVFNNYFDVW
nr:immunoglobulin heavy chain junction region [Macaca mulatta]MPN69510.1 immunoglobulin heavy chain junction region [Macaca mulatta]MPN69633.1 immunoglobulin heavy chain junction region [Macaca mulatta]MPN69977.1 immunoglobulin heavy chain junction region [Macaca mulatta]MPN72773.1 immunoglobulin heavy chain junction region [Macaca mulatta]